MCFLRITVLLILFITPLYYSPQKPDILDCNEVIRLGDHKGLKAVEGLINPITLLYLDTAYASHIVDWEFRRGFFREHPDSAGNYTLSLPRYTLEIATMTNNMHALSFLIAYYASVPRVSVSDTIYWMYDELGSLLQVFVARKHFVPQLEGKLRSDFNDWARISSITLPVKYPDPSVEFDRFLNFKSLNTRNDPRYVELLLGLALQEMGTPGFNEERITGLRKIQTCLANKRIRLPSLGKENMIFIEPIEKRIIPAIRPCRNISELLADKDIMSLLISSWLTSHNFDAHMQYSHSKFLVKPPDKAYFEIYYESGMQAIRLTLPGNNFIMIEKLTESID
jgi:hypothetical protein